MNEIGVELCVKCPLKEEYVIVKENCLGFKLREDGMRRDGDVRLHGDPSDFFYEPVKNASLQVQ